MSLLHSGLLDVEKFVRIMGSTDGVAPSNASLKSEISKPDSAIDMTSGTLDPTLLLAGSTHARESEISVEECGSAVHDLAVTSLDCDCAPLPVLR